MSGLIENESRCMEFKEKCKDLENTIRNLEENYKQSTQTDNQIIMSLQKDKIKYQGLAQQLDDALKENQELLNILQQKAGDEDLSRTNSQVELNPSCSTMSIVHLQYKYEELLASHHGLLKLLQLKSGEIKKVHDDNVQVKAEVEQLKADLEEAKGKLGRFHDKWTRLKATKNAKISKLKIQRETLQMVHNQLLCLLDNQFMEKDDEILNEIRNTADPEKALLLQEIKKNNMLAYENFQLTQKLEYLKSFVKAEKTSKETMS